MHSSDCNLRNIYNSQPKLHTVRHPQSQTASKTQQTDLQMKRQMKLRQNALLPAAPHFEEHLGTCLWSFRLHEYKRFPLKPVMTCESYGADRLDASVEPRFCQPLHTDQSRCHFAHLVPHTHVLRAAVLDPQRELTCIGSENLCSFKTHRGFESLSFLDLSQQSTATVSLPTA